MPPGDLDAARRLAVVWLEPTNGFFNPSQSITEALFRVIPHLQFELVPSGLGATYVRFRSHATREMAMALPDVMHEGVRIRLEREEEAQRVPLNANTCVLLWASPLAAEHFTPEGVNAFFSSFGEVLEIDPICLLGRDMSAVKGIVLVRSARDVPNDAWPSKGPWGARVVRVEVVKVWPYDRSFVNGEYQRYFGPPPPLPFRHSHRMALYGRPATRDVAVGAQPPNAQDGGRAVPGQGRRALALIMEAASPVVVATPAVAHMAGGAGTVYVVPPPSPLSTICFSDGRSSSRLSPWSSSDGSVVTSAESSPGRGGHVAVRAAVPLERVAAMLTASTMEVAEHVQRAPLIRKSSRLAGKEPELYVDMVSKAVKLKELKEQLKTCSSRLQTHVTKNKILSKLSPMSGRAVAALKAAAFGQSTPVHGGADD
jgi:hypothetical protein